MKKLLSIIVLALMLCSSAFAIGEHAAKATYDPDMDVQKGSWWDTVFGSDKLEIGTYNAAGSFTTNFFPGDVVTLKFDETSYNTVCASAKFVVEVYSPTGFKEAKYYWVDPINGNTHFSGSLTYTIGSELGTWTFVDYIYCVDSSVAAYLQPVSQANKISVSVVSKTSAQTCTAGWAGDAICSDGDVKRSYKNADCTTTLKLVDDCTSNEHCFAGVCEGPQCSSASQCEPWQECRSGECVATDASVAAWQATQTGGTTGGTGTTGGSGTIGGSGTSATTGGDSPTPTAQIVFVIGGIFLVVGIVMLFSPLFAFGIGSFILGAVMVGAVMLGAV